MSSFYSNPAERQLPAAHLGCFTGAAWHKAAGQSVPVFCEVNMKALKVAVFALAIVLAASISASALAVIDNMDDGGAYGAGTEMKDIIEGTGAVSKKASGGTIVLERTLDPPIDISEYRGIGYARLHLYIESVADMSDTPGQLELTSSGRCDVEETSWNISKSMLKDGWNTLYLSFESPGENAADLARINYVRVYIHITGENKVMLDELVVGTEDELGITAAGVETSEAVKLPSEVYGEGGAAAAALAAINAEATEQQAETSSDDVSGPKQNADTAQASTDTPKNLPAVAVLAAACCAVAAIAVYFIAKQRRK